MRIRITAKGGYSNPRRGIDAKLGELLTVDEALAAKLQHHGIAVLSPEMDRAPAIETTAVEPPANTAKRTHAPKARRSSPPAKEEAE